MEAGCRALALLGSKRAHAEILGTLGAEALAVDAISSVMECEKSQSLMMKMAVLLR